MAQHYVWMIDDNKLLLKVKESKVIVRGSPWNGKHRLEINASTPLKDVISLIRDTTNHIEEILYRATTFRILVDQ